MPGYRIGAYFDGEKFAKGPALLRVEGGAVQSITERSRVPEHEWESASPLFEQAALIPLLADAHIHSFLEPWPLEPARRKPVPDPFPRALRRVAGAFFSGVGLLRDGGDPHGINLRVRAECENAAAQAAGTSRYRPEAPDGGAGAPGRRAGPPGPGVPSPRAPGDRTPREFTPGYQWPACRAPVYLVPGPALHAPGRYGGFLGRAVGGRAEMKEIVDALIAEGVDFVKVIATGIIDFKTGEVKGRPQFDEVDLRYLVDLCHDRGLKVMAHASGREGVAQAVAAGVDTIEHGYFVDRATLERMAERKISWTPTLAPVWVQARHFEACGWDGSVRDVLQSILRGHLEAIGLAVEMGVPVLTGSDAGAPGVDQAGGIHLELELMQQAGLSSAALLAMTSQATPRALGVPPLPALRPGERLLAVAAPLRVMEDVRAIREAKSLFVEGEPAPFVAPRVHPDDGDPGDEADRATGNCRDSSDRPGGFSGQPEPRRSQRQSGANRGGAGEPGRPTGGWTAT